MEVSSNLQAKLLQLMKQLDKEVRRLTKTVADNPNTKRVIKETSLVIRSLMSQATTTEMWTMMKTRDLQRGKEPGDGSYYDGDEKDVLAGRSPALPGKLEIVPGVHDGFPLKRGWVG